MDTSRDNYSKWSQKEKGQISYDITYMWNLKKMAQWTFLQNRNRFTNFEIKLMVTKGKPWINQRMGFPHSSVGKESACSAGDSGLILGLGRSTGEGIGYSLQYFGASLVAQLVKNSPSVWETWVQSLGWEDPLEKGTATHSSILAWRTPWTGIPSGVKDWETSTSLVLKWESWSR